MAARAMWKAELDVHKTRIPVKLYAAAEDRRVHFRLLHARDQLPVKQQMVDPATDEVVPPEAIRRAVQIERGTFVLLSPEEQAALEPKPSREITIERVVAARALDLRWFDRPYYLGPDGDDEGYFALAAALEASRWIGIAHWVMRKKRYSGAVYGSGGYLMLDTMRYAADIVEVESIRPPADRKPDPREIKLAEQLIGTLEDEFDPREYHDEHRDKVMALLEAKAKGKVVRMPKAAKPKAAGSLLKDLQASLAARKRNGDGRRSA